MKELERNTFFTVIYASVGLRLTQCHPHETLAAARECAKTLNEPMRILKWEKDADPQFSELPVREETA